MIEYDSEDIADAETAVGEIKAAVVRLRMGTNEQKAEKREDLIENINYQANRIATLLRNGVIADEAEIEARR